MMFDLNTPPADLGAATAKLLKEAVLAESYEDDPLDYDPEEEAADLAAFAAALGIDADDNNQEA